VAIQTVRRDMVKRLAQAGRLVMVEGYSFDDQYGEDRSQGEAIPVEFFQRGAPPSSRREGTLYLSDWDLSSGSGRAWKNENGTITLKIHSNLNYTFKVLDK
jgi:hypothetical protein